MNTFGSYLRECRDRHNPRLSQEDVAKNIGKSTMLISNYETGKADPPKGDSLSSLIAALDLSEENAMKMRFIAASSRQTVPDDVADYFFESPAVYRCIQLAKSFGKDDSFWDNVSSAMEDEL